MWSPVRRTPIPRPLIGEMPSTTRANAGAVPVPNQYVFSAIYVFRRLVPLYSVILDNFDCRKMERTRSLIDEPGVDISLRSGFAHVVDKAGLSAVSVAPAPHGPHGARRVDLSASGGLVLIPKVVTHIGRPVLGRNPRRLQRSSRDPVCDPTAFSPPTKKPAFAGLLQNWRRGRDSNPRYAYTYA